MADLRRAAGQALGKMFIDPGKGYVFTVRRSPSGDSRPEGVSPRYTAITLLGLRFEDAQLVSEALRGSSCDAVLAHLIENCVRSDNLGDTALATWAANWISPRVAGGVYARMTQLWGSRATHPTVEAAWMLDALCETESSTSVDQLRVTLAQALLAAQNPDSGLWPHHIGKGGPRSRAHVGCFADQVYPIHALANYSRISNDRQALNAADDGGKAICDLQGTSGQWWWHYDVRTRRTLDPYPVYSVHQHAMAPMALRALHEAGGRDWSDAIRRGVEWMVSVPELGGSSILDSDEGFAWRKVGRREPSKLTRKLQTMASAVHSSLRIPGVDIVFPPVVVDYECRPYEIGWMLYAWRRDRV